MQAEERLYTDRYTMNELSAAPTIVVERDSGEPVYLQIARRIRGFVGDGKLRPGDQLPTVRALAQDLGVNLNTVARAYRSLAEAGFIRIRGRSGAAIASPPEAPPGGTERRLRGVLRELLIDMHQAGLTAGALRRLVGSELNHFLLDKGRAGPGRKS